MMPGVIHLNTIICLTSAFQAMHVLAPAADAHLSLCLMVLLEWSIMALGVS